MEFNQGRGLQDSLSYMDAHGGLLKSHMGLIQRKPRSGVRENSINLTYPYQPVGKIKNKQRHVGHPLAAHRSLIKDFLEVFFMFFNKNEVISRFLYDRTWLLKVNVQWLFYFATHIGGNCKYKYENARPHQAHVGVNFL